FYIQPFYQAAVAEYTPPAARGLSYGFTYLGTSALGHSPPRSPERFLPTSHRGFYSRCWPSSPCSAAGSVRICSFGPTLSDPQSSVMLQCRMDAPDSCFWNISVAVTGDESTRNCW